MKGVLTAYFHLSLGKRHLLKLITQLSTLQSKCRSVAQILRYSTLQMCLAMIKTCLFFHDIALTSFNWYKRYK